MMKELGATERLGVDPLMQQIFDSNLAMQDLPFLRWRPPCPTNFHMLKLILRASKTLSTSGAATRLASR